MRYDELIDERPTFVDLFCGAGGLSLGLEQAGFVPLLALDNDPGSVQTYRANRPWLPPDRAILGDIADWLPPKDTAESLLQRAGRQPVAVVGGVPCQAFSHANRQRLADDPRTVLYQDFIDAVKLLRPQVVLVENVEGIKKVAGEIVEAFSEIGYHAEFSTHNAVDFGLPQNRKRIFFLAVPATDLFQDRMRISAVFADMKERASKMPRYLLGDALHGLRPLVPHSTKNAASEEWASGLSVETATPGERNAYLDAINEGEACSKVYNHRARYNNERDIEIFRRLPPGGRADDPSIAELMPYKRREHIFKDKYYKLRLDSVSKTITAHMKFDCNMYIHPTQPRGLTPREAARIQSFPDSYRFYGTLTRWYQQIGNAVPPLLARVVGASLRNLVSLDSAAEKPLATAAG